jgi:predicted phage terminase large subunit-like protein
MSNDPHDMYRSILRIYFIAFVQRAFLELHPNVPFHWNWHLEVVCAKLVDVMTGKIKRLIITLPPRSLKSHIVSVCFPAFVLGHRPNIQLLCASYGQNLGEAFALETLQLMKSEFYREIFDTGLEREAVADFTTTDHGGRFTTSVGGVMTGRGGNIFIIDDPLKADEAASETCRTNANNWMSTTAYSRLNNKMDDAIIIVAQRLHQDDLPGYVLARENWDVVSFPAIATHDESYIIETPFGRRTYGRKAGEALHPEREDLASLQATQKRMGSAAFAAQYQQDPVPPEGMYVKPDWFPRYLPAMLPSSFSRIVISWDTANKVSEAADYSVGTVWGTKGDSWAPDGEDIFLLEVIRHKWDFWDLERNVVEVAQRYISQGPVVTLIEDCASGVPLLQRLRRRGYDVEACKPEGDKQSRLYGQLAIMERGRVHLPQQAAWLPDYMDELKAFPNGRNDDQVDSTSQALRWIEQTPSEPGMLAYYRNEATRKPVEEPETSFELPSGSTVWRLPGGEEIYPVNGVITVSGELVRWARRAGWKELPRKSAA